MNAKYNNWKFSSDNANDLIKNKLKKYILPKEAFLIIFSIAELIYIITVNKIINFKLINHN